MPRRSPPDPHPHRNRRKARPQCQSRWSRGSPERGLRLIAYRAKRRFAKPPHRIAGEFCPKGLAILALPSRPLCFNRWRRGLEAAAALLTEWAAMGEATCRRTAQTRQDIMQRSRTPVFLRPRTWRGEFVLFVGDPTFAPKNAEKGRGQRNKPQASDTKEAQKKIDGICRSRADLDGRTQIRSLWLGQSGW